MANVPFDEFLSDVLPNVPGVPTPMAISALRGACIEFCTDTLYWQESLDAELVSAEDLPLQVAVPSGAVLQQVLTCRVDGRRVGVVTHDVLDGVTDWDTQRGAPSSFYMADMYSIGLYPLPDAPVMVKARVALRPSQEASGVPDTVYQFWLDAIAAGAKARLMEMPNVGWSNPPLAKYFAAQFSSGKTAATVGANKSFGRALMQVQFRNA